MQSKLKQPLKHKNYYAWYTVPVLWATWMGELKMINESINSSSPSEQVEKVNFTLIRVYWHDLHTMQVVLTNSLNIIIDP